MFKEIISTLFLVIVTMASFYGFIMVSIQTAEYFEIAFSAGAVLLIILGSFLGALYVTYLAAFKTDTKNA